MRLNSAVTIALVTLTHRHNIAMEDELIDVRTSFYRTFHETSQDVSRNIILFAKYWRDVENKVRVFQSARECYLFNKKYNLLVIQYYSVPA